MVEEEDFETGDPSVPTELLDLHVQLEETFMTPEEFKEVFGAKTSDPDGMGSESASTQDSQGTQ